MRLIVATIQDYDAPGLLAELTTHGWGATQIASTGGALRSGTTTLLIGAPERQLSAILRLIDEHCRRSSELPGPEPSASDEGWYSSGLVTGESGGAAISVLKIVRFERL
jgi:uncharacterized protein YaaQ